MNRCAVYSITGMNGMGVSCLQAKATDAQLALSKLELQVALLSRAGLKRWEAAMVLGIGKGTIKSQLERVTAKLGPDWKNDASLKWPQLDPDVQQAVRALKITPGPTGRMTGGDGTAVSASDAAKAAADLPAAGEITAIPTHQGISFDTARRALSGKLSPEETAIIHLQGLPSKTGRTYLKKARSVQWQLLLNEGRVLHIGAGARFWLKPALAHLTNNRYIRFFHSDKTEAPYRPRWLPYITSGRVRATRAAYYKMGDNHAAEYSLSYLGNWINNELEAYVARLHKLMQQRSQALQSIARSAGRSVVPPLLPTLEELMTEARAAIGID